MPSLIDKIITNDDGDDDDDDTTAVPDDAANEEATKEEPEKAKADEEDSSPDGDSDGGESTTRLRKCGACGKKFYVANEFLILIILVILLARAYPPIGAIYLAPKITATWIAVMFIFLLAGLGLKTEEFSNALQQVRFNFFVFFFNFGVDSAFVFGVSRLLAYYEIIDQDLANGMVIAASVPLTINMSVVLTKASGGDEAAAICNSALWNLVGVFLSPALILGYIGVKGKLSLFVVFYKLGIRVLFPIVVGQLLKWFVPPVNDFAKTYKPYFKKAQMYSLVFIVYTVFCRTFAENENIPVKDIFLMILFIGISLAILMVVAWYLLQVFFRKEIKLRICGLYGCTHKTVAMGIPLINAIYDGDPAIGLYTLPLLIWHPMQLVVGTFLSPRLLAWSQSLEEESQKEVEFGDIEAKKLETDDTASAISAEIEV